MAEKALYKKLKVAFEDVERLTVEGEEIKPELITAALQKEIVGQVNEEFETSWKAQQAKVAVWLSRLKLYNNQRRDADAVGDPLLFTIFNTVMASLYDDRLMANWEGRGGEGDEDIEDNLNALSEYDYDVMGKDIVEYEWGWDSAFYGRGLCLMMEFNRAQEVMAPVPEIIDPATFIHDTRATSVNGGSGGRGAMRFGGYETGATYWELKKLPGYFNLEKLKKGSEIRSLLQEARQQRAAAQGTDSFPQQDEELGKYRNYEFNLLNWFTSIKGEKYLVTLGNSRSLVVRLVKLKYADRWPIIDRVVYPMAHDWDGVSIPDLVEDKQRMKAVLLNLGIKGAKADEMPRYLYDRTRIKNKNDLNYRSNKYIGVDGRVDNAMVPVQKNNASQWAQIILNILDNAAQKATATPETQQGMPVDQQRTLGELQLVASKVDTRYSMMAKVFGWSEKEFWRQWYRLYKLHFKDEIDEKVVRLQGPLAPVWRPLTRENIVAAIDPDVKIESRVISEAKRLREQQSFDNMAAILLQDPEVNRRYVQKRLAKLRGIKKEELDMMFPQTVDEIQAEDENSLLNAGKLPKIGIEDDHLVHMTIHAKANQGAHTLAHTRAHKQLMLLKRNRPDLFPQQTQPGFQPTGGQQPVAQNTAEMNKGAPTPVQ